jgi:hypothetical protein
VTYARGIIAIRVANRVVCMDILTKSDVSLADLCTVFQFPAAMLNHGVHRRISYISSSGAVIRPWIFFYDYWEYIHVSTRTVPAESFMATIAANINNPKITDKEFREFIRNTLPIISYPRPPKDKNGKL